MNKLEGFYQLKKLGLPTIPWKPYGKDTELDADILWTVRSAVKDGDDISLPRLIGVPAMEAEEFAKKRLDEMSPGDLVLYYPYFIAEKSGVIEIGNYRTVIEGVKDDLWNLVDGGQKDVTIISEDDDIRFIGDEAFFDHEELLLLIDYCVSLRKQLVSELNKGRTIFAEWSFAYESDREKNKTGEKELLFYEIRTI